MVLVEGALEGFFFGLWREEGRVSMRRGEGMETYAEVDACAPEGVVQLRDVCGVHGRRWGRDGCDGFGGRDRRRLWCGLWGHIVLILVLVLLVVLLVVCPASVVD